MRRAQRIRRTPGFLRGPTRYSINREAGTSSDLPWAHLGLIDCKRLWQFNYTQLDTEDEKIKRGRTSESKQDHVSIRPCSCAKSPVHQLEQHRDYAELVYFCLHSLRLSYGGVTNEVMGHGNRHVPAMQSRWGRI